MSNNVYRKRHRRPRPAVTASISAGASFPFGDFSLPPVRFGVPAMPATQAQPEPGIQFAPPDKLLADSVRVVIDLVARYPKETGMVLVVGGLLLLLANSSGQPERA